MQTWTKCTADFLNYDSKADVGLYGYIVRLTDEFIEVCYDDDKGAVKYRGKNNGDGHYELKAPERNGRAYLHCFPNGHTLEDSWIEDGVRGMWRIYLK